MPALTREELLAGLTESEKPKEKKTLDRLLYDIAQKKKTQATNKITLDEWTAYRDILQQLNTKAAEEFRNAVWISGGKWNAVGLGYIEKEQVIDYAYELVTKYSEGATEAACEFYDAIADLSGAKVLPAVPAETATIAEVAQAINAVTAVTEDIVAISNAMGRLVKQAGQDTTLQNGIRDGAECAWIPAGKTCAFCLALASKGWVEASDELIKNGHASHIHANCDCAYAVRFDKAFSIDGYNEKKYESIYKKAPGNTAKEKIRSMRQAIESDKKTKELIKQQHHEAYIRRKEANQ